MLARGEAISAIVASFCGGCSAGRAAQAGYLEALSELPTLRVRRRVLEHFLRTFNGARLHGSQWRVVDYAGYVGRQHDAVPKHPVERVDPHTGEYSYERPKGYPNKGPKGRSDTNKRYCPTERAGGLAALSDRSPRTLNEYRRKLRAVGVWASKQPPVEARDAVRPRRSDGTWAYGQHWLRLPPTPEMLSRWRGRTASPPLHDVRHAPQRPYSAAQPPRAATLGRLAALAERAS